MGWKYGQLRDEKEMREKILITGGAGYIGSIIVPKLLENGYQVTVLDNFMYAQNSLLDISYHSDLDIIVSDVRDQNILKKQVAKHDIVIPLAAIVGVPACKRDKLLAEVVNHIQIQNIAEWTTANQMILFPNTNSGYGIGKQDIYCDEKTSLNPISHYGHTKVEAEKVLLDRGNAVTFRLATVFGVSPRMRMDLLVNDFVYRAYRESYIVLFESHFKRNYIHIMDIASVFMHAINNYNAMRGDAYNVGLSNANLSKLELCEKIKKYLPDLQIFESDFDQDPDKRDYIVSNEKIESLGWEPKYSLDDGIKELIKVYSFLKVNPHNNI